MTVAAITVLPFAIPVTGTLITSPLLILAGLAVALLSTTIPFTLEFEALKRIPPRVYGILVSLEPAVAAAVGVILLGETMGAQGILAVFCVVAAAIGITFSERNEN